MTLAELGAKLREAREARNMTVADVADRLKIPGRILHGVEEASDRLPRTVYVHHFIKDYAKLMGFSQAEIAEWMSSLEGFENISRPNLSENVPFTSVKPSLLPVVLGWAIKLVLLAALAFGAYSAYVHFFAGRDYEDIVNIPAQEQAAPAAKAEPQAASVWEPVKPAAPKASAPDAMKADTSEGTATSQPEPTTVPVAAPAEKAAPTAPVWEGTPAAQPENEPAVTQVMEAPAEAAAPAEEGAEKAEPVAVVEQPTVPDVSAMVPAVDAEPVAEVADQGISELVALPEGMHHVEVIADAGECWMGFEPDGRKQQRTLRKGDSFTMTFRDSLVVKLGAASAVRVIYDGKELERSASTRVVTLRFPPAE